MTQGSIFVMLFTLWLSVTAQASVCSCTVDPYSKTYDSEAGIVSTWYGGKRAWSCLYSCTTPEGTSQIRARHQKTYIGSDNGLWGICDGLVYKEEYSTFRNDFVYMLDHQVKFDPSDSTSSDLKKFSAERCR